MTGKKVGLDHVKVAAPCSAEWDQMFSFQGERIRFCSQCNLNVYNLSEMTRGEAESLITRTEGRLCVRFYRRADGTILTQNCPIGLRAIKRKMTWAAQLVLGMALSLISGLGLGSLINAIKPIDLLTRPEVVVMGGIAAAHSTDEQPTR
jgi:hypothetical protein